MTLITPSKARPIEVYKGTKLKLVDNPDPKDTLRFDCLRCGKCCEYVMELRPDESRRIARHKQMSNQEFLDEYTVFRESERLGGGIYLRRDGADEKCVFYQSGKTGSCAINTVKPQRCVTMPVLSLYLDDSLKPKTFIQPCRGLGRGDERTIEDWMRRTKFNEMLKEDAAYIAKLQDIVRTTPKAKVRERITELFL